MNHSPNRELVISDDALQLPPAQRAVFVQQACVGEREGHDRVLKLLQAHENAE